MERGSSSLAVSGASGSTDSLNGLKFGKKIYFEDVGVGVSGKTSGGSSSAASSEMPAAGKKGRGVVAAGQPPRCQVEGCKVDLTGAKAYYCKHKVCGMHSKSPKVIVAGLEQRFCQQCSRFHELPQFDQGKRSCRRRLAGHNERRRKPPPGPLTSRFGHLSSSFHEERDRAGGFLMDFSYPRLPGRDVWSTIRAGDRVSSNQVTATGKYLSPHPWQGGVDAPATNVFTHGSHSYMHGSVGGTVFPGPEMPPGEPFAGVSDSACALSLLSTQPWGQRNRASSIVFANSEGASVAQPPPHGTVTSNFMSNSWRFKGHEGGSSSSEIPREMVLGGAPEPVNNQFLGQIEVAQQDSREYMDPGNSKACGSSSNQMHWSL